MVMVDCDMGCIERSRALDRLGKATLAGDLSAVKTETDFIISSFGQDVMDLFQRILDTVKSRRQE
jgi:hypothetical protein